MPIFPLIALSLLGLQSFDPSSNWTAVSGAIRQRYYGKVTMKEKMDRLLAEYDPKARAATSLAQFEAVVNDMIHDFGDSHFALLTRSDQAYYLMDGLLKSFGGG